MTSLSSSEWKVKMRSIDSLSNTFFGQSSKNFLIFKISQLVAILNA
jgi:hypothetical protein